MKGSTLYPWRLLVVVGAALLSACATSQSAQKVGIKGPAVGAEGSAPEPVITSRAKLKFEDAVKTLEAQRKSGAVDYAALERKFQAAADEDPRFGEAWYNLGVIAERQGHVDAAVGHYQKALDAKPTLRQAAENLGVLAQNRGDSAAAAAVYQKILDVYPDDASSRARLAELYRLNGELDRALEFSKEALLRDPKTLSAYKVMMQVHLARKQLSLAKLVALRATKLDENDPELYHTMGLILVEEKEPAKARAQFEKAVEVRPEFLPARLVLMKLAFEAEDYAGAEAHLMRIRQGEPRNAELLVNLGVAYKGQGKYDNALQIYDEAEKLKGDLAAIHFNRGVIIADAKAAPDRALEHYRKFIQASGGDVALAGDHPVFAKIKEAELAIAAKEEERRALDEAKRMEAEAKAAEDRAKAEAAQQAAQAPQAQKPGKEGDDSVKPPEAAPEKAAAPAPKAPVVPAKGKQPEAKPTAPGDEPTDDL